MSTKGVTVSRELIDEVGTVVDMSSYTDDDGIASYYGVKFDKKLYEGDDFVWGVYLSQIAPVEQEDPMDDVDTEQAELDESIGLLLEGIEEDLYNAIENGVDRITFSVDLSNWYK
jgi:hypothetical protein